MTVYKTKPSKIKTKPKTTQRNTTIDILAQELQNKENRIARLREKLLEQQEHLKYKIRRINELKEEVIKLEEELKKRMN